MWLFCFHPIGQNLPRGHLHPISQVIFKKSVSKMEIREFLEALLDSTPVEEK